MRQWWIGVALLAVVGIGAWTWYASRPTAADEPTERTPHGTAAARREADPLPGLGDELDLSEHQDEERPSASPVPGAGPRRGSVQRIPPSTRPFETPAAASAFIEEHVLELFAAVAPGTDPKTIHKTCEPDGRICTFEGPWPGDDFFKEWIRAISAGKTGPDQLDGVMFSEFKPVDDGDGKRFVIVAHAP